MSQYLSKFGQRFCAESGTYSLMDDLGKALTTNPDMLFLGGGNPAHIPAVEAEIRTAYEQLATREQGLRQFCGNYQSPQGDPEFLQSVAEYLQRNCGWAVSEKNIAVANGSQAAFFVLFNMFAGEFADGSQRQVLLPIAPEYIGYESAGLSVGQFISKQPHIELLPNRQFKYEIDFQALEQLTEDSPKSIGAICISRPTNPTGNVISDQEQQRLAQLANKLAVPLIIDAAYGLPFPGILFEQESCEWNENIIYLLSLSKVGLPGVRTGIVVAKEETIAEFARATTALNLACASAGPALTKEWFATDHINFISRSLVQPFYRQACQAAVTAINEILADLPVRIHIPQGAIFLWLWCEDLPITSQTLYERLKARGVLVLSGHHFFIGLEEQWPHQHQCLRLSYCQPIEVIQKALVILADELKCAYG